MVNSKWNSLIAAVDTGSMTKAAIIMECSVSAMSQLITSLEEEVGVALLVRSSKGVTPTEEARILLPTVRELLRQEQKISELASSIKGVNEGVITIGSYPSVATHWLPKLMKHFLRDNSKVRIKIMEGLRQELADWLEQGMIDMAFMTRQDDMNYGWIDLRKDPMIAVLSKNHVRAIEKNYNLGWYEDENFIMPAAGRDEDVVRLLEKYSVKVNIENSTLQNLSTIAMIEQDMGMSIMNRLITERFECDVVKLPLNPPEYVMFGIAIPSLEKATVGSKLFLDFVEENFNKIIDEEQE